MDLTVKVIQYYHVLEMKLALLSVVGAFDLRPSHDRMLLDMYESAEGKDSFTIDQDAPDFDRRMDLLIELLYPKLLQDPMYLENEQAIETEAQTLCQQGFDPRNPGAKVDCNISRSGRIEPTNYK